MNLILQLRVNNEIGKGRIIRRRWTNEHLQLHHSWCAIAPLLQGCKLRKLHLSMPLVHSLNSTYKTWYTYNPHRSSFPQSPSLFAALQPEATSLQLCMADCIECILRFMTGTSYVIYPRISPLHVKHGECIAEAEGMIWYRFKFASHGRKRWKIANDSG